jgi:hypothetical protein
VGGTDLHRMPSDGWPSYFGAAAVSPTTVLFRQETKLQEATSCLFPLVVRFRKTIASSKPFYFLRFFRSSLWTTNTKPDNLGNGYRFPDRIRIVVFSTSSRSVLVPTQLSTHWVPEVKWLEREPDHSTPYSAVAKTAWTVYLHGLVLN